MSASNSSADQQSLKPLRCDICDVSCATLYHLNQHMNGKRHKSQAQGVKTAKVVQCPICEVLVGGDFSIHENGKKHQQLLKGTKESKPPPPATTSPAPVSTATTTTPVSDAAPATLNIPPPRLRPVPITIHCNMCDQDLDGNDWVTHLEDLKHLRHERLARHSAMIWDSEQDKCGIKVEEKLLDFGLIDAETLRDDWIVMGSLHFSLTSQCRVELVEAEMTSNLDPLNEDMPTYFTVFSEALQLEYGTRYTIYILFGVKDRPKRYEDRIELVFKDVDLQQHFIITRPVQAMVAVEGDVDLLRPVSASFYESSVIPTSETNIPQHIYDAYGSIEEQTDRLRKKLLPAELNSETYRCYWKTLLWVEELSLSNDLRRYDTMSIFQESMSGTTLLYTSMFVFLTAASATNLPGLAERRPSLIMGDVVKVKEHDGSDIWFNGFVHSVWRDQVHLRLDTSFTNHFNSLYDIRFEPNPQRFKRLHTTLDNAFYPPRILFPDIGDVENLQPPSQSEMEDLILINHLIRKSQYQLLGVAAILNLPPGSVPFVISGAPGTGKTITIVEAVRQLLYKDRSIRILVCAPSNHESDIICEHLSPLGPHLFRLNSPARAVSNIPPNLKEFCYEREGAFAVPPAERLMKYRVIVSTCIAASALAQSNIPRTHVTHVFVDNAGLPLEPEALTPIRTIGGLQTNLVISGDPLQLRPEVNSPVAAALGVQTSYLDRLLGLSFYEDPVYNGVTIVHLNHNFRNHPSILEFPIRTFYMNGQEQAITSMVDSSSPTSGGILPQDFAILFNSTNGEDQQQPTKPSYFNAVEASMANIYVQDFLSSPKFNITDKDIGIISPHQAQCSAIRGLLKSSNPEIKVATIDEFQGHERRVVILSTVRSNPRLIPHDIVHGLGLLSQPRRLNVAVTRARSLLIIIGDPDILGLDPLWRMLLNYIYQQGGWRGRPIPWNPNERVAMPTAKGKNPLNSLFTRSEMGLYMDEVEEWSKQAVLKAVNA